MLAHLCPFQILISLTCFLTDMLFSCVFAVIIFMHPYFFTILKALFWLYDLLASSMRMLIVFIWLLLIYSWIASAILYFLGWHCKWYPQWCFRRERLSNVVLPVSKWKSVPVWWGSYQRSYIRLHSEESGYGHPARSWKRWAVMKVIGFTSKLSVSFKAVSDCSLM